MKTKNTKKSKNFILELGSKIPSTKAGRVAIIMELLSTEYTDEDGQAHKKDPIITIEQAKKLLEVL